MAQFLNEDRLNQFKIFLQKTSLKRLCERSCSLTRRDYELNQKSPFTPILPMEQSTFKFSPNEINKYFSSNKNKTRNRRSFSPNPGDKIEDNPSPIFSPIIEENEHSFNIPPAPTNTPTIITFHVKSITPNCKSPQNNTLNPPSINVSNEFGDVSMEYLNAVLSPKIEEISLGSAVDEVSPNQSISVKSNTSSISSSSSILNRTLDSLSVFSILKVYKLTKYAALFAKEEIDLDVFKTMTDKELELIGITKQKDRKKILTAIKTYQNFM